MWAVLETGGKQYRVSPGEELKVEKLAGEEGQRLELDRVLVLQRDGEIRVGDPVVPGAKVVVSIVEHGKGKKIKGFTYRSKTNSRRRYGHRQPYTRIKVEEIVD